MKRDEFQASLAYLRDLVALAGTTQVESYKRTTKTGKVVDVQAHTRSVEGMSNTDLFKEYKDLSAGKSELPEQQKRNRLSQVVNEIRSRKQKGEWGHQRKSAASQAAKRAQPGESGHTSRQEYETNRQVPQGAMTDEEYAAHVAQVRALLKDPKNQKYDTQQMHGVKDPETGKMIEGLYSPERAEQHKAIISDILARHENVPTDRKAIMSGGLGGAGKGYVLENKADVHHDDYLTIDPDEMKQELLKRGMVPEVPGLLPMEHAAFIHEESSDLAKLLQQVAMKRGMNIILDTTMANADKTVPKVEQFLDQDYEVEAVFVDVPIAVSLESALNRHRGGLDRFRAGEEKGHGEFGGRFVPPEYIQSAAPPEGSAFHSKNREAFEELKRRGVFSRSRVFDNSDRRPESEGGGTRLIEDTGEPPARKKKQEASKTSARAMDKVGLSARAVPLLPSVERLRKLTCVN